MSTQKGNSQRTRCQKHKNSTSFKNNLHDTSNRTKQINSLQVSYVCQRCKEVIEWKIKYKKYKPLTQPKTCVKCGQKNVRHAYHVMCKDCGIANQVCTKCCQKKEVVIGKPSQDEQTKLDNEMKNLLETLPERKRRTFLRYMRQGNLEETTKDDLKNKLEELKIESDSGSDFDLSNDEIST